MKATMEKITSTGECKSHNFLSDMIGECLRLMSVNSGNCLVYFLLRPNMILLKSHMIARIFNICNWYFLWLGAGRHRFGGLFEMLMTISGETPHQGQFLQRKWRQMRIVQCFGANTFRNSENKHRLISDQFFCSFGFKTII